MTLFRRKSKGNWHGSYTDASGRQIRRSTGTANKQVAQQILDQWKIESVTMRHGVSTTRMDLQTLLDQYEDYLSGTTDKHRDHTIKRLQRIFSAYGWTRPKQITRYEVETAVRRFTDEKTGQPLSLRTQSHYLAAAKMFTHWMVTVRMILPRDPLSEVRKPSWESDRKVIRRFLLPAEWQWLKLTPNALLYETAIQTGFRAGELAQLSPASLQTDHLYLPGSATKNGKDAIQYIAADLHARLKNRLPFAVSNMARLADLLRYDLGIARWFASNESQTLPDDLLQPIDSRGHVLDFHALRHTCGAWLAISGVGPKVIQAVMRHSSITLTLDTYGHLMPGAEKDAVSHFSRLLSCAGNVLGQMESSGQ